MVLDRQRTFFADLEVTSQSARGEHVNVRRIDAVIVDQRASRPIGPRHEAGPAAWNARLFMRYFCRSIGPLPAATCPYELPTVS